MTNTLSSTLLSLNFLSAQSMVEILLVLKNLKPVAAFPFLADFREDEASEQSFLNWLDKAGLVYVKVKDSPLWVISKNESLAIEMKDIIFSNSLDDIIRKSVLFGYPKETAAAYYSQFSKDKKLYPKPSSLSSEDLAKLISWSSYCRYVLRDGKEMEDSQTARKWQELIRKEIPELDKKFVYEVSGV